jgi:hypothetical protein
MCTETKFLDAIGTEVLRIFLLVIHSHPLLMDFTTPPPPPSKSDFKLVCNVNIVYGKIMPRNLNEIVRS